MIKSLDLSSYSINCIVEVICDEVLQNIDIPLFIDNFPLDVENRIFDGYPELSVKDDDGKFISLGSTTYFCDRSEYNNRKSINGFKKIQYNSKNKFYIKPMPIISKGLYCSACMEKGPEQHSINCPIPFETSLRYTVDGIEKCNVGNKFYEYVESVDEYGRYQIKNQYIIHDNDELTNIPYNPKKKNIDNTYLPEVFISEYVKRNKKSIIKLYIKNDSNIKIIINSNPWNNLGLYSKVINKINKTFENINSNYRIDQKKVKLRILSTTISIPFSTTHYLNIKEFIEFLRNNNDIYNISYDNRLYEYNDTKYEILIESKKNNREILKVQTYNKNNIQNIFKYTIQLFKQSFQITISFASDEIKDEYIYINPKELKLKIENEINNSYNMLYSLINIFYQKYPEYFTEDISSSEKDTVLTKCGKIPYAKLKLTISDGKQLSNKNIVDRKFIIYDVNNQTWDNSKIYSITGINNSYELYMSMIQKTVIDINGNENVVNINPEPPISVPIYLIGHLLKNTSSGYKEAGTSVCEEHIKVRVREYPEDDASKRPFPYSFYGKCLGGERFYVDKLGVQSYNDNKFYPCSRRNLTMPELLQYTVNFIMNGQTNSELKEYIIPKEDNIDFYCGTFIPNTVYIGAVIDIKQKYDDDYHPVRIIEKIKPVNSSANTSIFNYKVVDVDETGLSEPSDDEYIITVNDIHPKYSENRRFKGIKNIFNNQNDIKNFLLDLANKNDLIHFKPKLFTKIQNQNQNLQNQFNYQFINKNNINTFKQNKKNYLLFIIPKNSIISIITLSNNKLTLITEKDIYETMINYNGPEIKIKGFYYNIGKNSQINNEEDGIFDLNNESDKKDLGTFFILDKIKNNNLINQINRILETEFVFYTRFTNNSINLLKNNKDSYNVYFMSLQNELNDLYWKEIDNSIVLMKSNEEYNINKLNQIEGTEFSNIDKQGNVVPFIKNIPLEPDTIYLNNTFHIMIPKSGKKNEQIFNMLTTFMKSIPQGSFVQLFVNVYETKEGKKVATLMHPILSSKKDYIGIDKTINKYETIASSLELDELIKELI